MVVTDGQRSYTFSGLWFHAQPPVPSEHHFVINFVSATGEVLKAMTEDSFPI